LAFTTHAHAVTLRDLGATMAPMNAFQTLLGIETLALRIERHCANAQKVAEFLDAHDLVNWVSYAGLESSPYHGLAKKYLNGGFGSVFTFGVKGGTGSAYEIGMKVVESCELCSHLANVGDARSLILHPASTTHRQLTDAQALSAWRPSTTSSPTSTRRSRPPPPEPTRRRSSGGGVNLVGPISSLPQGRYAPCGHVDRASEASCHRPGA
jgi:O-acetylhomoserine/O-acetylserine sulfhydrylase-like pyridoxal-dependent enzyme